ncbi:hypothetical protein MPL3365_150187 [Mesorhizobium plurifarium]|uniref:Uncharacterized protein n=1 Tax=Mesorhizobium plurifarium TaxID=69974 RepID=A0A090G512_MESPL|nr:hypothetical protein MPL3365_150187 [Mesorhizobium plurifarium]
MVKRRLRGWLPPAGSDGGFDEFFDDPPLFAAPPLFAERPRGRIAGRAGCERLLYLALLVDGRPAAGAADAGAVRHGDAEPAAAAGFPRHHRSFAIPDCAEEHPGRFAAAGRYGARRRHRSHRGQRRRRVERQCLRAKLQGGDAADQVRRRLPRRSAALPGADRRHQVVERRRQAADALRRKWRDARQALFVGRRKVRRPDFQWAAYLAYKVGYADIQVRPACEWRLPALPVLTYFRYAPLRFLEPTVLGSA